LLDAELQHKYITFTGLFRLTGVFDSLVRTGAIPQGSLFGGKGRTKWMVTANGDCKCTQIGTANQLIVGGPQLDVNLATWKTYKPWARFESRMPGLRAQDLFGLQLPFQQQ